MRYGRRRISLLVGHTNPANLMRRLLIFDHQLHRPNITLQQIDLSPKHTVARPAPFTQGILNIGTNLGPFFL